LARENPVRSEGEFFRGSDNTLIELKENIIGNFEFVVHMKDVIMYRTERYYRERNLNI
jgi:hypothetical protein